MTLPALICGLFVVPPMLPSVAVRAAELNHSPGVLSDSCVGLELEDLWAPNGKGILDAQTDCIKERIQQRGSAELLVIVEMAKGSRLAAMAIWELAVRAYWHSEDCSEAEALYNDLMESYPETEEAARAEIANVTRCKNVEAEGNQIVQALSRVAERWEGTTEGAYALFELANML